MPRKSNSVKLINAVVDQLKEAGMIVTVVKEPNIDANSAVEHHIDLDVIYDEVIFNVRVEAIFFAGLLEEN